MEVIFFNANQKVRLIWRFLSFILVMMLVGIPLQLGIRQLLDPGLLRGNLSVLINTIAVFSSLYVQIKYIDQSTFEKYGLKMKGIWWTEFVVGCLIAVVQISLFFVLMKWSGNLVVTDFMVSNVEGAGFTEAFISEIWRQLTVGFNEEIQFRAFLFFIAYESLNHLVKNRSRSAIIACLLVSPLFGLAHAGNDGATLFSTINLGLDALMICLPFLITGRLALSIGMHFAWNVMQGAIFGFANSGNTAKASWISSEMQDNMWTGGDFGPEGSVLLLGLTILAVIFIVMWKYYIKYDAWVHHNIIANDGQ